MEQKKKVISKAVRLCMGAAVSLYTVLVLSAGYALAATAAVTPAKAADDAGEKLQKLAVGILGGLAVVIVIIIGFGFLRGGRKAEEAKEGVPDKIIGVVLIVLGPVIAAAIITALKAINPLP